MSTQPELAFNSTCLICKQDKFKTTCPGYSKGGISIIGNREVPINTPSRNDNQNIGFNAQTFIAAPSTPPKPLLNPEGISTATRHNHSVHVCGSPQEMIVFYPVIHNRLIRVPTSRTTAKRVNRSERTAFEDKLPARGLSQQKPHHFAETNCEATKIAPNNNATVHNTRFAQFSINAQPATSYYQISPFQLDADYIMTPDEIRRYADSRRQAQFK